MSFADYTLKTIKRQCKSHFRAVSINMTSYSQVPLGNYLFYRLSQVTRTVFGVPGDFNLNLLEHIYDVPGIEWCGNNNELNAGYAADGYARINKFAAFVTTYGVGELSAFNAIAGSFAENAPVLQIVGTSPTGTKNAKPFQSLHHLIPAKKGYEAQDHFVYEKLVEPFSVCSESLSVENLDKVQDQIDSVIEKIIINFKPGYLFIPCDMPKMMIDVDLKKPLKLTIDITSKETEVAGLILKKLYTSRNPAIIGDAFMRNVKPELNEFLQKTNFYCYNSFGAKGLIHETLPNYHGVYNNGLSTRTTADIIKENDLVIRLGANLNESNDFKKGSTILDKEYIVIGFDYAKNGDDVIPDVNAENIFKEMLRLVNYNNLPQVTTRSSSADFTKGATAGPKNTSITQVSLAQYMATFLQPQDAIVTEMCSFQFEIADLKFPHDVTFTGQPFYGSIGYAVPATLGVAMAKRDYHLPGRVVLFQGDGSAQMTMQELALYMTQESINPIVFMLNNSGYSVERVIKGPTRSYNDIAANWQWSQMLKAFGDPLCLRHNAEKIDTIEKLYDYKFVEGKVNFLELILDKMDVPHRFKKLAGVSN